MSADRKDVSLLHCNAKHVLASGETAQLWNKMLIIAVNDITDKFDEWEQDAEISNGYLSSVICMFQEQVVWQLSVA